MIKNELLRFGVAVVLFGLSFGGCQKNDENDTGSTSGDASGKYDGVYDFSIVVPKPGGGDSTMVLPAGFFIIRNGVISSSDSTLSGTVLDDFGNISFTGPCTVNGLGANFTGIMDALAGPKFGQGSYTCQYGGITRTWRAYNGR